MANLPKATVPDSSRDFANVAGGVSNLLNAQNSRNQPVSSSSQTIGDVGPLRDIIAKMNASGDLEGMDALIKAIFKKGTESGMQGILSNVNQSGAIPQSSTTARLLENDLLARLTGEAATALGAQQERIARASGQLAETTKTAQSSSGTEKKKSGTGDILSLLGLGVGATLGGPAGASVGATAGDLLGGLFD